MMSGHTLNPGYSSGPRVSRAWFAIAIVLDFLVIAIFAVGGRRSHDNVFDFSDLLHTAWPFLVGLLVGWGVSLLAANVRQRPYSAALTTVFPSAVVIWIVTWLLGIMLRLATGETASGQFPLVTGAFLAAGFIGWRLVALLVKSRRR